MIFIVCIIITINLYDIVTCLFLVLLVIVLVLVVAAPVFVFPVAS